MPVPIPGRRPEGYDKSFWESLDQDTARDFRDVGCDWNKLPPEQRDKCIETHNEAMRQSYNNDN